MKEDEEINFSNVGTIDIDLGFLENNLKTDIVYIIICILATPVVAVWWVRDKYKDIKAKIELRRFRRSL